MEFPDNELKEAAIRAKREGEFIILAVFESLQKRTYEIAAANGFHEDGDVPDNHILKIFSRLVLVHSEVSEILEELRKLEIDWDKVGEECADVIIRMLDLAQSCGIDLGNEVLKKMDKNSRRPYKHGKAF